MRGSAIKIGAVVSAAVLVLAALAAAEVSQRGNLRVAFSGKINPNALPRQGTAPVAVSIGGRITTTDDSPPPQLQRIEIQINRQGRLDYEGLPVCRTRQIQPSSTRDALRSCGDALVGRGSFSANVVLPEQSPFPSRGRVLAFNGKVNGRPVLLAHVYGTDPIPTSYTLPFAIKRSNGTFGTALVSYLPQATADWGFVTGISMTLHRRFSFRGRTHSYISAGCPAPAGFPGAVFPLARASFDFAGGRTLSATLTRSCRVGS